MSARWKYVACAVVVVAIGTTLRLPELSRRPMHTDEAVHAVKFGRLLEEGFYRYDPGEYHGPSLNYFTLISAWLSGISRYKDLAEVTLRIVPVAFGIFLVLMPFLLGKGLGRAGVTSAAFFTAVSPAFVFYSRYYIQEMLLVFFTLALIVSGYRYVKNPRLVWAILAGLSLGLMHATKETCVIAVVSILGALLLTNLTAKAERRSKPGGRPRAKKSHVLVFVLAAVGTSVLFYSSFFTNPGGIFDSVRTYGSYLDKGTTPGLHVHPWYYYLEMLTCWRFGDGPVWSEGFVLVFAVAGFAVAMARIHVAGFDRSFVRFIGFYTLIMTAVYSAIPYKTPWSMLSFYHGMILLAGVGVGYFLKISRQRWRKLVVGGVLAASVVSLGFEAWLGSFRFYADVRNPYVYAHTSKDIFKIIKRVEAVAKADPAGKELYIQVIFPGGDYWPLPWYLRRFPNVGWWSEVDEQAPAAPLILASPDVKAALVKKLYELTPEGQRNLYVPLFDEYVELRPGVEALGYVTNELWQRYLRGKGAER